MPALTEGLVDTRRFVGALIEGSVTALWEAGVVINPISQMAMRKC
jgi:hypothetical protein